MFYGSTTNASVVFVFYFLAPIFNHSKFSHFFAWIWIFSFYFLLITNNSVATNKNWNCDANLLWYLSWNYLTNVWANLWKRCVCYNICILKCHNRTIYKKTIAIWFFWQFDNIFVHFISFHQWTPLLSFDWKPHFLYMKPLIWANFHTIRPNIFLSTSDFISSKMHHIYFMPPSKFQWNIVAIHFSDRDIAAKINQFRS